MASIGAPTVTGERSFTVTCTGLEEGKTYELWSWIKNSGTKHFTDTAKARSSSATFSVTLTSYYTVSNINDLDLRDTSGKYITNRNVSMSYSPSTSPSEPTTPTTPSETALSKPSYISCSSYNVNTYNGGSVTVSWGSSSGASYYSLKKWKKGSNGMSTLVWSKKVYITSYKDTLSLSDGTVSYVVSAYNSSGTSSGNVSSSEVTVYYNKPNTAPTVPSSITVPSTVYGGKPFTVSWGKSTDSDGNLSGYKLEKSINGGSTWTQEYQGSTASTSVTLAFGEATQVMFRVRAYDSSGAHSGYKASGTSTVVNNKAPTAPQSITVPLNIYGGKTAVVTWTAATDSDGNLSGYILERSVNSGTYTQVYKGANKSYSDSITKGWNTIQYRVCAYDSYNEKGAYKTAQVRNIINNELPVITTNSTNLGLKTGAFSFSYTVSDQESNKLTVVEKINGVQKKSFTATSGSTYTFQITQQEFICILNGTNTLSITVTDTDGGVTTKNITFQKKENEIAFTLKTPFETDAAASVGIMNVVRQIPEGVDFTIEACNNAYDTSPTWEDVTRFVRENRNFILLNEQKTASKWGFSFKVTVRRNTAQGEIYISSVGGNFK